MSEGEQTKKFRTIQNKIVHQGQQKGIDIDTKLIEPKVIEDEKWEKGILETHATILCTSKEKDSNQWK